MAVLVGPTRKRLSELALLIDQWQMERADSLFRELVAGVPKETLTLISPDLRGLSERFQKKRRKALSDLLEAALSDEQRANGVLEGAIAPILTPDRQRITPDYRDRLNNLRDKHIFQWTTHYRENLLFIFKDMLARLREQAEWEDEIERVGTLFKEHSRDIFERGFQFSLDRKFEPDIAIAKSSGGLQRFIYLVMNLMIEEAPTFRGANEARLAWDLVSKVICEILGGYGNAFFGDISGWSLLAENLRHWLPALGFARGSDARKLIEEFPEELKPEGVYTTVVPLLAAMERFANRFLGDSCVYPRLARVTLGFPPRLDVSLVISERETARDLMVSAFFEGETTSKRAVDDAIALRAAVVVARLASQLRAYSEDWKAQVIDASGVVVSPHEVEDFSELVFGRLEARSSVAAAALERHTLARNFAAEFPLDDPDFRQLFTVERYSVKTLLDGLRRGNGIHLWCSVRRSGKTTAALNLAGLADSSQVVFQTMDHQPTQVDQNVLEQRVREALLSGAPIAADFFQQIVNECVLMAAPSGQGRKKIVLVIDEYESLFGLISAMTSRDQGLRFTVAQPLMSQMVGFATKNLLIFMGQRPDAHLVLSSQNQLSPLVKQHNFPLFEHIPGSTTSEFSQFLNRVLTDGLPFVGAFSDAVHRETRGHPYLTVNLMVDFCDWLITTNAKAEQSLEAELFKAFERDRLSMAALQKSPHYAFFQGMLSEFLSERGREHEPWLFSVTSVLKELGKAKKAMSISACQKMALPFCDVSVSPDRLLASAAMSNFVRIADSQVYPGIPLMGRLAAAAQPRIN